MPTWFDTHAHLDDFAADGTLDAVLDHAASAGVTRICAMGGSPAANALAARLAVERPDTLVAAVGLDRDQSTTPPDLPALRDLAQSSPATIRAIGEIGLDYYWSREFEKEQLEAFEEQVRWAVELQLPLMIHCRKAQNEMVAIIKKYAQDLVGGVFHCFTGNEQEARQLLDFPQFMLGIGGVLTFKKSHLPETLAAVVPLDRIVLETDAPYMAPVPMRGQRNESSFIRYVITRLAEAYGVSEEEICKRTNENVTRVFGI